MALTVALTVLFASGYALSVELSKPPPPAAPPLEAAAVDGGTFRLSDHRGQVVVVDFFATWCEPCHVVESNLWSLRNESLDFVPVSVGVDPTEDMDTLTAYSESRGMPWTVAKGDEATRDAWDVEVYAHVAIVDAEGRVRDVLTGSPSLDALRDAIRDAHG